MKGLWHLVFAGLRQQKRFTSLFILNLALGLTGFVTLDSFRTNLESSLAMKSRFVLGADLGISARHPISPEQLTEVEGVLGESVDKSQMTELYSMVASAQGDSRLIQIKAIDGSFPFYGAIQLRQQGEQKGSGEYDLQREKKVWVYPEVLIQLGVEVGDKLKIGQSDFVISDIVEDDAAAGFSTSMAPRIYMGLEQLADTGLITSESLAWYSVVFRLASSDGSAESESRLQELVDEIFQLPALPSSVRVFSHKNASEQMSRLLAYLGDYLGLVSIAAIFLASLGAAFLFRNELQAKIKEMAILRSLGLSYGKTLRIYLYQSLFLGLMASLLTFILSQLLNPLLALVLEKLVSVPITIEWGWQGFLIAGLLGLLGSLLIGLPILVQMRGVKPALLFQEAVAARLRANWQTYALYAFSFILLWLLSVWQAHSWLVGSIFIGMFSLSGLLLGALAYGLIWLFDHYSHRMPLVFKLSLRNLCRQPKSSIPCFLALGLGVMLLNIIPQIEASLQGELQYPERSRLPSFFLFDIQEEQVTELKDVVKGFGLGLSQLSPMIRANLREINGQPFVKANANGEVFSREEAREARFRNRGFNLSYRAGLSLEETIVEGREFSGRFDPETQRVAEVSLEKRFAGRIGADVGDQMTFEVQSIPIEAKVINLRSVRWTSFQPNFFIQFQEGVLEDAPKTFLATLGDMSLDLRLKVQNAIVEALPNISLVDVTRLVKRLSEISRQMSVALQLMAGLCLLVGFLVMYSIASHQAGQRKKDINLIKVLGAPASFIRNVFVLEFVLLALLAGLMGLFLSIGVSYFISEVLFEGLWNWNPWIPFLSLFLLFVLVATLAHLSVAKVMKTRARLLF